MINLEKTVLARSELCLNKGGARPLKGLSKRSNKTCSTKEKHISPLPHHQSVQNLWLLTNLETAKVTKDVCVFDERVLAIWVNLRGIVTAPRRQVFLNKPH